MGNRNKILAVFTLVLLIFLKVSAFHTYEHDEQEETESECHLCELAIENQIADFEFIAPTDFKSEPSYEIGASPTLNFPKNFTPTPTKFAFFSRPPPVFL